MGKILKKLVIAVLTTTVIMGSFTAVTFADEDTGETSDVNIEVLESEGANIETVDEETSEIEITEMQTCETADSETENTAEETVEIENTAEETVEIEKLESEAVEHVAAETEESTGADSEKYEETDSTDASLLNEQEETVVNTESAGTIEGLSEDSLDNGNSKSCEITNKHSYYRNVCKYCGKIKEGFAYVNGKWAVYDSEGNLNTAVTGIYKGTINGKTNYYYAEGGYYKKSTGLFRKYGGSSTLFYVRNGAYTKATGIVKATINGKKAYYYVKKGIYKRVSGLAPKYGSDSEKLYYVKNGKYTKATGIAKKLASSDNSYYYVKAGVYTKESAVAYKADGSSATRYHVRKGKYKTGAGFARINGKYYYFNSKGVLQTGWKKVDGKWYFLTPYEGYCATGLYEIDGKGYYFNKKGVMQTGWKKVDDEWYYFYSNGAMARATWVDGYYLSVMGRWVDISDANKREAATLKIAREIANSVLKDKSLKTDREKVYAAATIVNMYYNHCTYTMSGDNYYSAYGVFVYGEASCAGSTRALGLVLSCMGYSWTHANAGQYSHQWCILTMDGKVGYADAGITSSIYMAYVGYGTHPVAG